jgi:mannitol-1-phosphate 5-dehydrogenase
VVAYLGYYQGHRYVHDAMSDAGILAIANAAIDESAQGVAHHYGTDVQSQRDYGLEFLEHLANPSLLDRVTRVARDPLRKLGIDDRLVTPARWAVQGGLEPRALAWGIAAALAYDDPQDEAALELQGLLQRGGLDSVLREVCGIEPQSALGGLVRGCYCSLQAREGLPHLRHAS